MAGDIVTGDPYYRAETSWVGVAQHLAVAKQKIEVVVFGNGGIGAHKVEPPRHAKVNHQIAGI